MARDKRPWFRQERVQLADLKSFRLQPSTNGLQPPVIILDDNDPRHSTGGPPFLCSQPRLPLHLEHQRQCALILAHGYTLDDLRRLILYLQQEIRPGRRYVGALKLSNLLQLDRFEEDLALTCRQLRPPSPPPSAPVPGVSRSEPSTAAGQPTFGWIAARAGAMVRQLEKTDLDCDWRWRLESGPLQPRTARHRSIGVAHRKLRQSQPHRACR